MNDAIWVCLKIGKTPKPNGFADHYPYEKWLFHWEYTLFSDKPICFWHLRHCTYCTSPRFCEKPFDDGFFHQETTSSAHPSRQVWTILATLSLTRGVVSPVRVNQRHERSDHSEASSNQFFWRHGPSMVPGLLRASAPQWKRCSRGSNNPSPHLANP